MPTVLERFTIQHAAPWESVVSLVEDGGITLEIRTGDSLQTFYLGDGRSTVMAFAEAFLRVAANLDPADDKNTRITTYVEHGRKVV